MIKKVKHSGVRLLMQWLLILDWFLPEMKSCFDAIVRNMKEKYDGFMHTGIFGLGRIGRIITFWQ